MTVVPGGWATERLLDLVAIRRGQVDPREPQYRDMPLIAPDHIEVGTGRLLGVSSAREQGAISGKYLVDPGDVIYSKIRPYLMKAHRAQFSALCSADMYPLKPRDGVDGLYVVNVLLGRRFTNFAVGESMRSGIPKVNREALAGYELPVPPKSEQRAIGEVLSDADDLIMALEKLIAKKRDVKQGMMQELLTGRTRLPGFTDDWSAGTVQTLAAVTGGGTPATRTSSYWGGGIPWFTPAEIDSAGSRLVSQSERTITLDGLANSSATLLPAGAVLVTSRASLGNCAVADVPVSTNQGFASLVPRDFRSTWFLYYWMQQNKTELESRAAGSTFLEISSGRVSEIPILAPGLDEQEVIGEVLKDADTEVQALERRLESARAVKVGMMQELLTGRTRLPVKEET